MDGKWRGTSKWDGEDVEVELTGDSAAYLMYTSGSTGQPRGVVVTHRNVIRSVKEQNYATLDENQVILQFASLSFDASTFEIWGSLLNGGQLVLFPGMQPDTRQLGQILENRGVTTLWLSLWVVWSHG